MSAAASAGASFRPSPTITTTSPSRRSAPTISALSSGVASAWTSAMPTARPTSAPTDGGVARQQHRPRARRAHALDDGGRIGAQRIRAADDAGGARRRSTTHTSATPGVRAGRATRADEGGAADAHAPPVDARLDAVAIGLVEAVRAAAARARAPRPRRGSPRPADAPTAARRRPRSRAARRTPRRPADGRSSASRSCRRRPPSQRPAARAACRP